MSGEVSGECTLGADGSCSICGDVAAPATVISVDPLERTAVVRCDGREEKVALDLVERAAPGDIVLVHLGFAISLLEVGG